MNDEYERKKNWKNKAFGHFMKQMNATQLLYIIAFIDELQSAIFSPNRIRFFFCWSVRKVFFLLMHNVCIQQAKLIYSFFSEIFSVPLTFRLEWYCVKVSKLWAWPENQIVHNIRLEIYGNWKAEIKENKEMDLFTENFSNQSMLFNLNTWNMIFYMIFSSLHPWDDTYSRRE